MNLFQKTVSLTSLALLLAGCAVVPDHKPLTELQSQQAVVEGFPADIRFWADEPPQGLNDVVAQSILSFKVTNDEYFRHYQAYPPVSFLALSGGGDNGAFGAGFLSGWTKAGTRPNFSLVTGVSTGALIAPLAFLGPANDEQIQDLFTKTKTDNIFLVDIWTFLSGLTGGLSLTDATPFVERIQQTYTPELLDQIAAEYRKGRRLFIGTTNIEAQRGVIWDMGEIAASSSPDRVALFQKIIQASAAVPGVFAPVFIDVTIGGKRYNEIHVDGGVTSQVFLYPLQMSRNTIDNFRNCGIERNLYIIRNAKTAPEYQILRDPGLFSIGARTIESLTKNNGVGDLYRLYLGAERDGASYHAVQIPPDFTETPKEAFDPVYMSKLFALGVQMGQENGVWQTSPPGFDAAIQ